MSQYEKRDASDSPMEMHLSIILYFTYLADDTRDGDYIVPRLKW